MFQRYIRSPSFISLLGRSRRSLYSTTSQNNQGREREKPIRSISEIKESAKLFSPKQYDRMLKSNQKILRRDDLKELRAHSLREKEKKKEKQQKEQYDMDKTSSVMTKGAHKRKMTAITNWAKREHPDIWEHIVAKISLKETLKGKPWEPAVLLSYEEMEEMKELRKLNPKKWSYPQLGYKFGVSALSASKIVTSNFAPTPEQRVMRWLEREEFKSIQTTFLKSVAKEERAKLIEADLKSRYGNLYTPPPKHRDPFISKLTQMDEKLQDDEDSDEIYDSDESEGEHKTELKSEGGMTSVYRRITAEAKAVVQAKLETNRNYYIKYHQDVNRIKQKQFIEKQKEQQLQKNIDSNIKKRTFFNMFEETDDENSVSRTKSKPEQKNNYSKLKSTPWRQKHEISRKSSNIIQWPKEEQN